MREGRGVKVLHTHLFDAIFFYGEAVEGEERSGVKVLHTHLFDAIFSRVALSMCWPKCALA